MQIRLFFFYSLVFILIIILASVPTYIYLKRGIEKNALNTMNETVGNVAEKLDARLKEFDNISKQLYLSTDSNNRTIIQHLGILQNDKGSFDEVESVQAVYSLLGLVTSIYNDIHRLTIFTSRDVVYSNPKAQMSVAKAYPDSFELQEIRHSAGETVLRYSAHDRWANTGASPVFNFSRLLNPRQDKIAVIEMQIRAGDMLPLDQIRSISGAILTLSDGDRILFDSAAGDASQPRRNEYVFRKNIESANLTISLTVPRRVVLSELVLFRNFSLATLFVLVVFSLLVYYYLSRLLTQPLVKLKEAIDSIDLEDKRLNIDNKYKVNEIERINRSFRNMNSRLQHSLEQIVQFRMTQLQSQFDTLQAQINPHFLFNMLGIIQESAENGELPQVRTISRSLSEFMRYSISIDSPVTTLDTEVSFSMRYLELMKTRYMHRLTYSFDFDQNMLHMMVPKLIIQPLSENAINHGFAGIPHPLHIEATGRLVGEQWEIRFRDNGAGFGSERLEEVRLKVQEALDHLNSDFDTVKLGMGGMGLTSTIVRLKLMFRSKLQVEIGDHPDGGAEITMRGLING
ncbi:HAMP domain-containing protein [Cohnella endophytica]|uniref:HAMP domain-containing protein n=1 Tax=Cohnella endophytica TaxID=2419778 RepID=A0A494X518_9BACL|nr:histidine kinase [Cohnella endophytica]RKP45432.1 HAMP domain-containing protein [Cohnella endophytica]